MGAQAVRLSNVDIDKALDNKDFEVRFQPIFDLGNGALARMETFVRWRHPTLGVLPPGAFISFFETQGRMSELTRYVLAGALKAYSDWRGTAAPGFSINLALSDLSDEAFSSHFIKLLRDFQFPADLVTLECPMPAVDTDLDIAAAQFARLGATGARLAIEVRGRANDLLRNIDPFPFDEIKTGGSSILRFARTVRGPGLSAISDLLEIANDANAVITAVGVEDQASLSALRGLGFTAAQGNHLGKVGDITDFLPSRVNDVRQLLGLDVLSTESLTALFRTDAPAPQVNELEAFTIEDEVQPDALIERLNDRLAQQKGAEEKTDKSEGNEEALPAAALDDAETDIDQKRKAKAREKAKILAVAKREKARDIRKAAAIARAKAKSEQTLSTSPAPRELQQRLSKEFASGSRDSNNKTSIPQDGDTAMETTPPPKAAAINKNTTHEMDGGDKLSVPEKLAAVSKAAEATSVLLPKDQPNSNNKRQQNVQMKTIRMPVGAVGAHFRPGIIVGGPAFNQEVRSPSIDAANARNANAQTANAQGQQPNNVSVVDAVASTENTADLPGRNDTHISGANPIDASDHTQLETNVEGDVDQTPARPQQTLHRRKPTRKPFLKRTVLPYPTHFWPKSWARGYRRWSAKRSDNDATENIAQAAE